MLKTAKIQYIVVCLLLSASLICASILFVQQQNLGADFKSALIVTAVMCMVLAIVTLIYAVGSPERAYVNGESRKVEPSFPPYVGPRDQFNIHFWTTYEDEDRRHPEDYRKE